MAVHSAVLKAVQSVVLRVDWKAAMKAAPLEQWSVGKLADLSAAMSVACLAGLWAVQWGLRSAATMADQKAAPKALCWAVRMVAQMVA